MSRWSPDSRGRLEQAAYELFNERGYDQTTVADIAARAGLTERTFFRQYADKREVFFGGSQALKDVMLEAVAALPPGVSAIEAVRVAVEAIAHFMRDRRSMARERQRIVDAHADLQERGLIKRATLTAALADGLRQRGVSESEANLAADLGMSIFYIGFTEWIDDPAEREFVAIVHEKFEQLKTLASGA
jgi:AcrR family transcriptional regulator